jgi:putative solute:sodium symporter small subunit
MRLSERHRAYWRKNLQLTALLMAVWFLVTFLPVYFAHELNRISVFGWPLAFYMGAQGALLVYVLVVWLYARAMNRMDARYGVDEGE